jgi:hypothetical protein
MGAAIDRWNQRGGNDPPRNHDNKSPTFLVREALLRCPDENPSRETTALSFITDQPLRQSIRLDMSSASDALHRGDFKGSTVLAGAAIEALLLWRIVDAGITVPIQGVQTRKAGHPDDWKMEEYILVCESRGFIKPDTVKQVRLAQAFATSYIQVSPGA